MENKDGVVTVRFCETKVIKKFIYPASIESFLMLENPVTAKQYKNYTDKIADEKAAVRKDASEKLRLERLAKKKQAKPVKRAQKKPVKKAGDTAADIKNAAEGL